MVENSYISYEKNKTYLFNLISWSRKPAFQTKEIALDEYVIHRDHKKIQRIIKNMTAEDTSVKTNNFNTLLCSYEIVRIGNHLIYCRTMEQRL